MVSNGASGTVSLLRGNGDGTFQSPESWSVGYGWAYALKVADLDGNGLPDLAVAVSNVGLVILLGNGAGSFAPPVSYAYGSGNVYYMSQGDFNLDGKIDLAFANDSTGSINVFIGNGDGSFNNPNIFASGSGPTMLEFTDFNNDLIPDLAAPLYTSPYVKVFSGSGDGTFISPVSFATGTRPYAGVATDLNGDRKQDLLVTNYYSDSISVLLNNADYHWPVRIERTNPVSYIMLQEAYIDALNGEVIQAKVSTFNDSLYCNHHVEVTIRGGWDDEFLGYNAGMSTIRGQLEILYGTVITENIVIQ